MWTALHAFGVPDSAEILEPGCGTGNFIQGAPSGAQVTGVELDPTTAKIAGMLHPSATVLNESFADTVLDGDGYDAVIGNVPFSEVRLHDPAYNLANLSLHNHFIVKSLRMTKPGGLVAVMTSRWTLDSKSGRSREEIAKYGEFLGAVRMPANAHMETAGTEAIIDVVVFRRHLPDTVTQSHPEWMHTSMLQGDVGETQLNSYFAARPDMMLGTATVRKGKFGAELHVSAEQADTASVAARLTRALQNIVTESARDAKVWAAAGQRVTDRPVARVKQDQTQLVGRVFLDAAGEPKMVGISGELPVKVPKNAVPELRSLLRLRDAAVAVLNAEASTHEDTAELAELRKKLNEAYDDQLTKHGALGRFTETVREREGKEPVITRRYPPALKALRTDPHFATVVALERFNEATGEARKATIFTARVVGVRPTVQSVSSVDDALRVSIDQVGKVDPGFMGDLLQLSETEVIEQLGDRVFDTLEGEYVTAAEFLSGNVRKRHREYQIAAETDEKFNRHVYALAEVIPHEVGPNEISVRFGAAWLPEATMEQFIGTTLGSQVAKFERLNGEWRFELSNRPSAAADEKWGVRGDFASWNARKVVDAVANQGTLRVTYVSDEKTFVDEEATEVLQERATELHEAFQDWLWRDGERAEEHQALYNDLYNGIVLRSYDDARLTFPGKAATFTPHAHQHAAVARILAEPAVGLFHEVGAGKTAEMVLGVMELRRLGMVQKPAIVVPNQMLEQFTREFKQIYPQAQVLAAGAEDVSAAGSAEARKLFVHRAKTNDWDAVIITHSAFTSIGLGESKAAYVDMKLAEIDEAQAAIVASSLSNVTVKTLEKDRARAEENLKKQLAFAQDEGVSWDETGIDYLAVDELHLFKNLAVASKVPDLNKAKGSQRAQDLEQKLWYHREYLGQKRVLTGATATPLPNSMIEMFVMMRYLRPDLLAEARVYHADEWAAQFTEQVTSIEAKPGGGGFQSKTRTSKFRNLPELLSMWHVPGDVKTQADLGLKVPSFMADAEGNRAPEMVVVPATQEQKAMMATLMERAEAVKAQSVPPEEDNMLKITSDGRAIALDVRLRGGEAPLPEELSKADVAVARIHRIWEQNREQEYLDEWGELSDAKGALQIVFADLGTPKEDQWNVYDHIREGLVERGIPREQVRFIHEATNDKSKAELFQQCRQGQVAVVIGSTEKMGVGTNVQNRAIAEHHIDPPWRPADVTQREGRLIRQGNQNSEIRIIRYSTEGSFDAYMWGTLARKASFIDQVFSGRLDAREADNSSEMALQFAEIQAVTLGDMRVLEAANLRQEIQKLSRQERGHNRQVDAARSRRLLYSGMTRAYENDLQTLSGVLGRIKPTSGERFNATVKPAGMLEPRQFSERSEFGKTLQHQVQAAFAGQRSRFGMWNSTHVLSTQMKVGVGGLEWSAGFRYQPDRPSEPLVLFQLEEAHKALQVQMDMTRISDGDASSLSRAFENRVSTAPEEVVRIGNQISNLREQVTELEALESQIWPYKTKLEAYQARLGELVAELETEASELKPKEGPKLPQYVRSLSDTSSLNAPTISARMNI